MDPSYRFLLLLTSINSTCTIPCRETQTILHVLIQGQTGKEGLFTDVLVVSALGRQSESMWCTQLYNEITFHTLKKIVNVSENPQFADHSLGRMKKIYE